MFGTCTEYLRTSPSTPRGRGAGRCAVYELQHFTDTFDETLTTLAPERQRALRKIGRILHKEQEVPRAS